MLHTYFCLLLACEPIRPHVAKRLPETHRNNQLLCCYSPVFSDQFDVDKNCALTRARLNKRWVTQRASRLSCWGRGCEQRSLIQVGIQDLASLFSSRSIHEFGFLVNVQFQKISILPPTEGIGISWGMGGSGRSKNMKKCMKLYWDFQRSGEVLEKNPFRWGGMDIFWNYTMFTCTIMCRHFLHQFNPGKLPRNDIKIYFML